MSNSQLNSFAAGMAIVDAALNPQACWEFDAEILIITHSTTITKNYEAVIHCGCTRQTAKIVSMDGEVLRSGHRATVRFIAASIYLSCEIADQDHYSLGSIPLQAASGVSEGG